MVLFGATGDLARRKPLPGLLHLSDSGLMPDFRIVGASPPALEAYERLIYDHTLLANAPGIERLWEASQALLDEPPAVLSYPAGSWGPRAMHGLLAPRTWRLPFERCWRGPH